MPFTETTWSPSLEREEEGGRGGRGEGEKGGGGKEEGRRYREGRTGKRRERDGERRKEREMEQSGGGRAEHPQPQHIHSCLSTCSE